MFRTICKVTENVSIKKELVRTKFIKQPSLLNTTKKIKEYNKTNLDLFGPLLETRKEKIRREKREAKNRSENNTAHKLKESTQKFIDIANNAVICDYHLLRISIPSLRLLKNKMWQKTRNCFNLTGITLNNVPVKSFKTSSHINAASSTPQPGYVSDDKILQIKEYQNDYTREYPAVTLILSKTMTKESRILLNKWKQEKIAEMGEKEFNRFYNEQMAVGTKFHNTLKTYFTQPRSQLRIEKEVEGVWNSVSELLKRISSPKAIESNVVHPVLKYRGIFDAIADYEDKPMLIEWKKSDKPRKMLATTYDNPVQLAAYFGAMNNDLNYKHFNVRDALLVIAYTDGSKATVFHLTTDKLRENWARWLIRLEEFNKLYNSKGSEKRLEGGKRMFEEDIGSL